MSEKITEAMVEAAQGVFTSWGYSASNPKCLKAALSAALTQAAEPVTTNERTISHEYVLGYEVYAYCEESEYGGTFSTHWSTPTREPIVKLFTEAQLLAALYTAPPVASLEPEGNAARQIERFAILRNLGENHGGENEAAPDQASIDAAIAFIRRWGLPDNALTTLGDEGCAVIELHGENYADITFHVSARPTPPCDGRAEAMEAEVRRLREALSHAPDPRHFDILAEAMSEVKATSDGESDQPITDIVAGCLAEVRALTQKDKADE